MTWVERRTQKILSSRWELHPQPSRQQSDALTTELLRTLVISRSFVGWHNHCIVQSHNLKWTHVLLNCIVQSRSTTKIAQLNNKIYTVWVFMRKIQRNSCLMSVLTCKCHNHSLVSAPISYAKITEWSNT